MSSAWTHSCCDRCYAARRPGQVPIRVPAHMRGLEMCCFCLRSTTSGIYYRADPQVTRCQLATPTHQE